MHSRTAAMRGDVLQRQTVLRSCARSGARCCTGRAGYDSSRRRRPLELPDEGLTGARGKCRSHIRNRFGRSVKRAWRAGGRNVSALLTAVCRSVLLLRGCSSSCDGPRRSGSISSDCRPAHQRLIKTISEICRPRPCCPTAKKRRCARAFLFEPMRDWTMLRVTPFPGNEAACDSRESICHDR
jgi:hypothetical protein